MDLCEAQPAGHCNRVHYSEARSLPTCLPYLCVKKHAAHGTISEIERCLMHRMVIIIAALLVVGLTQAAAAADASTSADNRKTEKSKGITVDDLGRGLKSAAQNIEKGIPKMGSAIGNAVKKITEKGPERPSSQEPAKQKKRVNSVRV